MRNFLWVLALLAVCSRGAWADDGYIRMSSNGLERRYVLVTPAGAKGEPLPLVIVLHGGIGTGRKMQMGLGFDRYVDKLGFAVAYPDAYIEPGQDKTTRWNDGRGTLASSSLKVDDVAFLRDMVKHIGQHVPLDMSRIFVTGPSNGGMMTYRAACEAADLFAAAAPVIANIPRNLASQCRPARPISILAINGTADPYVPFEGGTVCKNVSPSRCERGEVVSTTESLDVFARRAGCSPAPQKQALPTKFAQDVPAERLSYPRCREGTKVEAIWIHGGGHNWPPHGGQIGTGTGTPTRNLDATQVILEFFLGHV